MSKKNVKMFVSLSRNVCGTKKYLGLKMTSFGRLEIRMMYEVPLSSKRWNICLQTIKKSHTFLRRGVLITQNSRVNLKFLSTTTTILQGHSFILLPIIFHYFWWAPFVQNCQSRPKIASLFDDWQLLTNCCFKEIGNFKTFMATKSDKSLKIGNQNHKCHLAMFCFIPL